MNVSGVIAAWERLRRQRREGMHADLIRREDPRIAEALRHSPFYYTRASSSGPGWSAAGPWELTAFTCPRCGRTSWNPNDAREGYCGNCHDWTGTALLGNGAGQRPAAEGAEPEGPGGNGGDDPADSHRGQRE